MGRRRKKEKTSTVVSPMLAETHQLQRFTPADDPDRYRVFSPRPKLDADYDFTEPDRTKPRRKAMAPKCSVS